jgi:A/G-specific adenine glycosylase
MADGGTGARGRGAAPADDVENLGFSAVEFRRKLGTWYRENARRLPWRDIEDPYATWLSEIMLQQTRVATVIDRYIVFLRHFPTIRDLAEAEEADVLALWSGLGYYRRARMLHRGAQFVERELHGMLPRTAAELRKLPGVGEYTAAAIASIAFGENVAVLDGNVERVLLRVLGEPEEKSAKARARLTEVAQTLAPPVVKSRGSRSRNAQVLPRDERSNPAGDHNQAMMELGAVICLPRSPLCGECPVFEFCKTRGEHVTPARAKMQSRKVAYVLALRKRGVETEVLLEHRPPDASLMAGMLELPGVPLDAAAGREPALRLRHAITNTNYYVEIFTESVMSDGGETSPERSLVDQIPASLADLEWVISKKLLQLPLTGLARKAMQRLQVMAVPKVKMPRAMTDRQAEPILAATPGGAGGMIHDDEA